MSVEDLTKKQESGLRDAMAMSAMNAMVAGEWMPSEVRRHMSYEFIAEEAYKMADAMLEAR